MALMSLYGCFSIAAAATIATAATTVAYNSWPRARDATASVRDTFHTVVITIVAAVVPVLGFLHDLFIVAFVPRRDPVPLGRRAAIARERRASHIALARTRSFERRRTAREATRLPALPIGMAFS